MPSDIKDKLKLAVIWALRILSGVIALGVIASASDSNQWWIRGWDFPRMQLMALMLLMAAALWQFDRPMRPWLVPILLVLSAWQFWRISPYTPIVSTQVASIEDDMIGDNSCFSVLSLNVLQKNREYNRTLDVIKRIDPDILLLMETDQAWADAMAPAMANYPSQQLRPLDNTYGIMFATRLSMRDASIQDFAQADTPSVVATLGFDGDEFKMIALHPRPPHPGQDTEERDAELIMAAKLAKNAEMPVIAIGDFNDVAWSDTTRLFMQMGELLDPRIGRGTYPTFPADKTYLGWPLDHLFVSKDFLLEEMRVLEMVGSDHRPILAKICLKPAMGEARNADPEKADPEEVRESEKVMKDFEEDTAKERTSGE